MYLDVKHKYSVLLTRYEECFINLIPKQILSLWSSHVTTVLKWLINVHGLITHGQPRHPPTTPGICIEAYRLVLLSHTCSLWHVHISGIPDRKLMLDADLTNGVPMHSQALSSNPIQHEKVTRNWIDVTGRKHDLLDNMLFWHAGRQQILVLLDQWSCFRGKEIFSHFISGYGNACFLKQNNKLLKVCHVLVNCLQCWYIPKVCKHLSYTCTYVSSLPRRLLPFTGKGGCVVTPAESMKNRQSSTLWT